MAPIALIAAGQVMLLICGEIDLAVGRVYALAPAIVYVVSSEEQHGLPIWVGWWRRSPSRPLVGLTNGVITTFLRVPSFITTLGMLFLLNGITLHLLAGTQVFMPGGDLFQKIFGSQPFEYFLYFNSEFWWALGIVLALQFVLTRTRWGLHTIATGGNLDRRRRERRQRADGQDRQLRARQRARRLRGNPGLDPDHDDRPAAGRRRHHVPRGRRRRDRRHLAVRRSGSVIGAFIGVAVLVILRTGFSIIGVSAFTFDLIIGIAIIASMIVNVQVARLRNLGRLQ